MIPVQPYDTEISPRPLSRLSYKIMGLNLIAVAMLIAGILYLDNYRKSLTSAETEILTTEARLYTSLLSDNAVAGNQIQKERAEKFLTSFAMQKSQRLRLLNAHGEIMMDIQTALKETPQKTSHNRITEVFAQGFAKAIDLFLPNFELPFYPAKDNQDLKAFPDIKDALAGKTSLSAWRSEEGGLILSAATPILKNRGTIGVLLVTRSDTQIERTFAAMRLDMAKFFLGALLITLAFSLYLSGVIGHPLRKLAYAIKMQREGRTGENLIPDLSFRKDEIGELSIALRDMTSALHERMQSIERFAADVAHELKNPLTSIRSAVETLPKITLDADRQRLMSIIQHDLLRMDRLISDISQASRLDAELPRDVMKPVNLSEILQSVIASFRVSDPGIDIVANGLQNNVIVEGNALRLSQVFQNLLSNALSFSAPALSVYITLRKSGPHKAQIDIEDEGPGIPQNAQQKIFERFYTERPNSFGNHSGLGLSIVKQILSAHDGQIAVQNRTGPTGDIKGARFTVILNTVEDA